MEAPPCPSALWQRQPFARLGKDSARSCHRSEQPRVRQPCPGPPIVTALARQAAIFTAAGGALKHGEHSFGESHSQPGRQGAGSAPLSLPSPEDRHSRCRLRRVSLVSLYLTCSFVARIWEFCRAAAVGFFGWSLWIDCTPGRDLAPAVCLLSGVAALPLWLSGS